MLAPAASSLTLKVSLIKDAKNILRASPLTIDVPTNEITYAIPPTSPMNVRSV